MTTVDIHRHASHKPLHAGDMESVLWGIEKDPLLRQTMTAVLILHRPPDRETLLDRIERASRTLPPLRHRLVEVPFRLSTPRWLVDPNFDLSYHVRWIAAPGKGSLDGVLEFARQSAMSGLDQARPLWVITVVEGLMGRRAAVILKMSHVLTDGVGSLALLTLLGDRTRTPREPGPMPAEPEPEGDLPWELAAEAATNAGQRIFGSITRSANAAVRAIPGVLALQ